MDINKVTKGYRLYKKKTFGAFFLILISITCSLPVQAKQQQANQEMMFSQNRAPVKKSRGNKLDKIISVHLKDIALINGLQTIAQKAGLKLVYSKEMVPINKHVTLQKDKIKVKEALWDLLDDTGLRFGVSSHNHLVLMKSSIMKKKTKKIQTGAITGTVIDAKTGETLPGTNIVIEGTTKGISTDKNGKYILSGVEVGKHMLIATFIGYKRQKKPTEVTANKTITVNFELVNSNSEIGETVVTGYGSVEKRKLTSSITTLSEDELGSETEGSLDKMLQGKAPGVSVIESSGAVGSVPIVRIRGSSTLTGSGQPLWVVDGVVLEDPVPLTPAEINSPDAVNRIGNSISGINPADIASINILKDASATAIYGVKAAEGVVVLTTKSGHRGDLRVNFQSRVGVTQPLSYDRFNLMNSKERIGIEKYYFNLGDEEYFNADANVNSVGLAGAYARYKNRDLETYADFEQAVRKAETYNTDWFDILYRKSISSFNNISFSGGSDKTTYRASFSATNQEGADILTDNDRYTGSLKLNFDLSDALDVEVYLSANSRKRTSYPRSLVPASGCTGSVVAGCQENSNSNIVSSGISSFARQTPRPFQYALNTSRTFPLKQDNGDYYMYRGHNDFYLFNVMNEYDNSNQTNKTNEIASRATINWDILKNLGVEGILSYSLGNTQNETYYTAQTNQVAGIRRSNYGEPVPEDSNLPRGGVIFSKDDFQHSYQARVSLHYLPIQTHKHNVELLAGGEYRQNVYRGDNTTGWGYLHNRGRVVSPSKNLAEELAGIPYLNITDYTRKYASYFGVATYTYNEKYTINTNIRYDGSNLFGSDPKYRWKPAWSVSGRWNISSESFMESSDFFNQLALRASYGIEGSANEQNTPQIVASFLAPGYWSNLNLLSIDQPANPDLRWEKTYTTNLGLDFSILDYRISGSVDVYNKQSKDLITNTRISEINGFSYLPINFADVSNKGIEFGLSTQNVQRKHFFWNTTINFSYNRNRVEKVNLDANVARLLSPFPYKPDAAIVGRPLSALYSVEFAGIDPSNGVARFRYANGDTTTATTGLEFGVNDLMYNGPIEAPFTGGFQNLIGYKDFEFSFFFTYGFGNKVRMDPILKSLMYSPDQNLSKELLNAWGVNGNTDTYVPNILDQRGTHTYKERWNQSDIRVANGAYLRLKNVRLKYDLPTSLLSRVGLKDGYLQIEGNNLFLFSDDRLNGYDPETFVYHSLPNLRSYAFSINVTF